MTDPTIGDRLLGLLTDGDSAMFGVPGGQTLPLYGAAAAAGARHVLVDVRTSDTASPVVRFGAVRRSPYG